MARRAHKLSQPQLSMSKRCALRVSEGGHPRRGAHRVVGRDTGGERGALEGRQERAGPPADAQRARRRQISRARQSIEVVAVQRVTSGACRSTFRSYTSSPLVLLSYARRETARRRRMRVLPLDCANGEAMSVKVRAHETGHVRARPSRRKPPKYIGDVGQSPPWSRQAALAIRSPSWAELHIF